MKLVDILAALGTAFLFLLAAVVLRSADHVQVTLDLLKLFIAWPPIFLLLALLFMKRYHDEIRSFLGRAIRVGPSGIEAERQLPPESPLPELTAAETAIEQAKELPVPADSAAPPEPGEPNGKKILPVPEELLKSIMRDYGKSRDEREYWKLHFLNQFLVHNTKSVLAWFAGLPAATLTDYDRTWRYSIPDSEQRTTVVDALTQYGLLASTPEGLQITDEGRRAVEFFSERTPLPFASPLPAPRIFPLPATSLSDNPHFAGLLESLGKRLAEDRNKSAAPSGLTRSGGLLDYEPRSDAVTKESMPDGKTPPPDASPKKTSGKS
jgi:hypothetical protein